MNDGPRPLSGSTKKRLLVWAGALALAGVAHLWLTITSMGPITARKHEAESEARGALRMLTTSQTIFREGDKEGDGMLDFGTLHELSNTSMIDGALGAGVKQGYRFEVRPSPTTPELLWFAVANPQEPTVSGDRYFCVNQDGVIFYTTARSISLREGGDECTIPARLLPLR